MIKRKQSGVLLPLHTKHHFNHILLVRHKLLNLGELREFHLLGGVFESYGNILKLLQKDFGANSLIGRQS